MLTDEQAARARSLPEQYIHIRRREVQRIYPVSKVQIDRLEKAGSFPKRIRLSPGCVVWKLSEIIEWVEERRANPPPTYGRPPNK
jgi:prophage regulatory protein